MTSKMCTAAEIGALVKSGKSLLIAGDEQVLRNLPKGNWIAGTIPYFMTADGGVSSKEKAFVTELPDFVQASSVQVYDGKSIANLYSEAPENGFSVVILPAMSEVHLAFAMNAPKFKDFAARPVVGWISGVHLSELGKSSPKVFNGKTGEATSEKAIVMRVTLPKDRVCDIGIVNIFSQGSGDTIEFRRTGFSTDEAIVNGKKTPFAQYILDRKIDTKVPMVANYCGANINVSFQNIDPKTGAVSFYAPVFEGIQYRLANPVTNYIQEFLTRMPKDGDDVLFSCNCILNFLYSELEGKKTGGVTGPFTFGEVAYQLLNQTLVYLTIHKL